jgi:tetratricopeptide (TPR) repeat protein
MGLFQALYLDPVALWMILAAACVAAALGVIAFRYRSRFPRWLRKILARKRLNVIRRDLDRMAEYVGALSASEPNAWPSFENGLAAMALYQWDKAIEDFQRAQSLAGNTQLVQIANQVGVCYYMQGRLDDALREFEKSVRIAEQHEDQPGKTAALCNIGLVCRSCGELDSARNRLAEALAIARETANQSAVALCLGNLGNVYREEGRLEDALKAHEEALAISRRIADEKGVVCGLGNIGSVLCDRGEPDRAFARCTEAVTMARRIGYKLGTVVELGNVGTLYRDQGELTKALESHEYALVFARQIGYRLGEATALGNIGLILVSKRTFDQAAPRLAESLTILLAAGVADGPRQVLYGLSKCDDALGRGHLQALMKRAGLAEESTAEALDRIDMRRSRRPWQTGRQRNPFAPTGR